MIQCWILLTMDVKGFENGPKTQVLILGDGNFSYSLLYARKHVAASNIRGNSSDSDPPYPPRDSSCSTDFANIILYATSYDSEETIKEDQLAWKNVQALKEMKDVTVLHDVDATHLGKQFDLRTKFAKVIFNFPHVGGKSNIKACRSLLERFFQCIVDFVTEEGKVYVALCKGQGGTPIDTQRKGYGNTWQVVTQAASAGLFLKKIKPFKIQKIPTYEPAGYRGKLQQGFVRDGSLTHIFLKKKRSKITPPNDETKFGSKELLITEADNFYKSELDQYNPFRIHSHPFVAACNTLFNCLDAVFKVQSRVTDEEVLGCSGQWYSLLDFTFPNDSDQSRLFMSETFIDSTVEVSPYSYPVYKEVVLTAPGKQFRSMHDFVSEIKQLMLDHCGKCSIETYQMNTTEKRDWGSSALVEHSVNNSTAYDASTTPNFLADIKMKSWLQLKPEVTVTREEKMDFNATTRGSDTVQYEQICFDDYDLSERELVYFDLKGRQLTYKNFFNDSSDVYGISVNGVLIAECCTILDKFSSSEPKTEACSTTGSFIAVIRIDLLSLALLGIDDVRLFWSKDEAYLRSLTDCLMKKLPRNEYPLLPVSYPLCYRHDLCFWVSDIISHDLLLAAIRNCCHDAVHSVKLLRILRHEETQLLSFCYRMIYSRCDGPLSHKETVELQNNLRKVLIDLKFDLR